MANNKIYSDYLMHYRTKGSRNGYSKDPNYTPIGQKAAEIIGRTGAGVGTVAGTGINTVRAYKSSPEYQKRRQEGLRKMLDPTAAGMGGVAATSFLEKKAGPLMRYKRFKDKQRERVKDFTGFMAKDIGDRAKTAAKKGRDFTGFMAKDVSDRAKTAAKKGREIADFVVEDNIDRGKSLIKKGKKKVAKLLKKFK